MSSVRLRSPAALGQTVLLDGVTGTNLHGVVRAIAICEVDSANIVRAEFIAPEIDVTGELQPMIVDPRDGEWREISRIVFADGSEWVA